jgi:hypothetical protein
MSQKEYTQDKPPSQECSICFENVDPDDTINGVPNCVTCENSHFIHRECYDKMKNNKCPQCREPVLYNCSGYYGYIKNNRKGGKTKNKRNNKKRNKKNKRKLTRKKYN